MLTAGFYSNNLTAWHGGDKLVLAVAAQNNNTIVVVHSVGPLILEPWIEHPNVTAVCVVYVCTFSLMLTWCFFRSYGLVLVVKRLGIPLSTFSTVTGTRQADSRTQSPNSRPITQLSLLPTEHRTRLCKSPTPKGTYNSKFPPEASGSEDYYSPCRLFIDYRHFDAVCSRLRWTIPEIEYFCQKHITPRFEFGFGLSYTKFGYSNLQVSQVSSPDNTDAEAQAGWHAGQASPYGQGSSAALWFVKTACQLRAC